MIFIRKKIYREASKWLEAISSCPSSMRKSLVFMDVCMENSYQKSNNSYQRLFLSFYILCLLVISVGLFLTTYLKENTANFDGPQWICLSLITLLLIGLVLSILDKQSKKYFNQTILMTQIFGCMGYLETCVRITYLSANPLWIIFPLEIFIYLPLISRCSWRVNSVGTLFLSLYFWLRIDCFGKTLKEEGQTFPYYYLVINPIIVSLGAFIKERFERNSFWQNEQNKTSLFCYQNLIKKILPSAILVFRDNEFIFFNQETKRLLNISAGDSIETKI
jgi:hypothetical protein